MFKYCFRYFLFFLTWFQVLISSAQLFPVKNYPRNYFSYPVQAQKSFVANFGELRPNHYHMGYDFRTEQVENKKILAAADGYIAKVKIEPWGFGRCIYINHPNGLTTLYAHLNAFYPELEKYIKQQQYKLTSWALFIDIPENLFPVQKGQTIALSGNTGGSQGPHLHFEIRDTKTDKVLNPSLFDFDIPDNIAPDLYKLALYNRAISTYEQTPRIFALHKKNGVYYAANSIIRVNTNKISFGIAATDRYNGSNNRNGIYETVLYHNDIPVIGFQIDSISYAETRYLNAHIDYKLRSSGGSYIQHISRLPGYYNSVYKGINSDGVISLDDNGVHRFKIEVKDAQGNLSVVEFKVQRDVQFNSSQPAQATYVNEKCFRPGFVNIFENENFRVHLPENSLYDTIHFQYKEISQPNGFSIFQIHHTGVPLHTYIPITIRASTAWPYKMVMHRFVNGKDDYARAEPVNQFLQKDWFRASFREFGNFQLLVDTIPPVMYPIGFRDGMNLSKQSRLVIVVKDNTEEITKFSAMLDGNWIRFSNDKGSRFIYDFDELCPPGKHELIVMAEDQVGNKTEKKYYFTR